MTLQSLQRGGGTTLPRTELLSAGGGFVHVSSEPLLMMEHGVGGAAGGPSILSEPQLPDGSTNCSMLSTGGYPAAHDGGCLMSSEMLS